MSNTSVHTARIVNGKLVVEYPEQGRPYQYFSHETMKSGLMLYPNNPDETIE